VSSVFSQRTRALGKHAQHGRGFRIGALVSKGESDQLYTDFMAPLLESYSAFIQDVNNASVFVRKGYLLDIMDGIFVGVQALADRLSKLDAADVTNWKADVLSAQQQMNMFANEFAVYTQKGNTAALYSSAVGVGVGALVAALVYRRKKSRKWTVIAGTSAAAASGFASWFVARPKFT